MPQMKTTFVPIEDVRRFVSYEPDTGQFYWKENRCAKYVGQPAGWWTTLGYRVITVRGKKLLAHRLAWVLMTGSWPREVIDHVDGDSRNNEWSNLREASQAQNTCNKVVQSNCKSGAQGVVWRADRNKWAAYINKRGRYMHIGYFGSFDDAVAARRAAALKVHGVFALDARPV